MLLGGLGLSVCYVVSAVLSEFEPTPAPVGMVSRHEVLLHDVVVGVNDLTFEHHKVVIHVWGSHARDSDQDPFTFIGNVAATRCYEECGKTLAISADLILEWEAIEEDFLDLTD